MGRSVELAESLALPRGGKILLAVLDGLGDVSVAELGGRTPLEAADIPNLDSLARDSAIGQHVPVAQGITPGSGPAHMALFGYDPVDNLIGRGVLEVLGIGFPLERGDLAARINFCTLDGDGVITDRRAGRIATGESAVLAEKLDSIAIPGVEVMVRPVKEHRACVVFRGEGLRDGLSDTDPGAVGFRPLPVGSPSPECARTAEVVGEFIRQAQEILKDQARANGVLLRGIALNRVFRSFGERFRLDPAAVALYPMYKGLASLLGMTLLESSPGDLSGQVAAVHRAISLGNDFVFLHHKYTDSAGEDGDWKRKITALEDFDNALPGFLGAGFDVVSVTGDHSTPCPMKQHSWHPVPLLLHGGNQRVGWNDSFSERQAVSGALGTINSLDLMPLLLASAGRLEKFGA
jgi:2,3-bisphosphoglycerate-independent phosphoglycerate mutase